MAKILIEKVYEDYYLYVYNYALKLTCHPEDAQDVTQETFLKALKGLEHVQSEYAIASWLRTICYHEFLNFVEKNQRKFLREIENLETLEQEYMQRSCETNLPEEEVFVAEEIRQLQNGCFFAMVRKLSLQQRIAFSLVDMYGMNVRELSELLSVSENAAKALLHRARLNLDSFFADHCNLLDAKNPCSCKAWVQFSTNREEHRAETRKLVERLDYREKGYLFDEKVRARVKYLYSHMPDWKPSEDWYQNLKKILLEA